jgi:hypothetical protein
MYFSSSAGMSALYLSSNRRYILSIFRRITHLGKVAKTPTLAGHRTGSGPLGQLRGRWPRAGLRTTPATGQGSHEVIRASITKLAIYR